MNIMNFFRKKPETRSATGLGGWPVGLSGTVQAWTASPHYAENLSGVYGCVAAISSALSALPVFVYQKGIKTRHEATTHDFMRLVNAGPNQWQTWPDFAEFTVAQVLLFGNALVEIITDRAGRVLELRPIPWTWVNVQILRNGRLVYDINEQFGVFGAIGQRRRLLSSDVIHLRDRSDDGVIGKSRLQRAAATLATSQAINQHTENQFRKGMAPSGLLTTPMQLTTEAKAAIQDSFTRFHSGAANAGKLLMLPGPDFDFKLMHVTPEDSELLASRKFTTEEICRIFQVPPPIICDYSHNTFTNSAQASRWFGQFCLLPWCRKLESAFNRALFSDGAYEFVLDMSGFDRADPETRWQAHALAVSSGILTVDEVREGEGYDPLPVHQNALGNASSEPVNP
jgi:HK97 family phage portal protein